MANILQVTTPSLNNNRNVIDTQGTKNDIHDQRIQNPVDPSRVVRADGQEEGRTGTATGEGSYSIIDYESNYGAFVQKLEEGLGLPGLLKQLFSKDTAGLLFGEQEGVGDLVEQLLSSVHIDSPEELLVLLKDQQAEQAKFSGPFFDGLRRLLASGEPSDGLKETVLAFLKGYNDFSSGGHQLKQMQSLAEDISRLMLRPFREDFRQLINSVDWEAPDGDTAGNAALFNSRLIPYLSNYISRTHDYGAVRNAVMLFILHAVKYENGDGEKLHQLFNRMTGSKEFQRWYPGNAGEDFENTLLSLRVRTSGRGFADVFSSLLLKGANGEAGLENIQQFYDIFNGMLLNESVYLPLMHLLIPFQYQGKDVMSEMWLDPDADREREDEERKIKMLLRFDIQSLGKFEMVMALQGRQVDMRLYVPESLTGEKDSIQEHITGILKKNNLGLDRLLVEKKTKDVRVEEVFREIRQKERTINVRI